MNEKWYKLQYDNAWHEVIRSKAKFDGRDGWVKILQCLLDKDRKSLYVDKGLLRPYFITIPPDADIASKIPNLSTSQFCK